MRCLLALVSGLALAGSNAHAQIKFADFTPAPAASDKTREVAFQEARKRADLKHGTLISVNLMNGSKVTGTIVRFDEANKRLLLRTRAGAAPVAYAENDIKKIDKATRTVDTDIRSVGYGPDGDEWSDLPEGRGIQVNQNGVLRLRPRTEWQAPIKPAALNRQPDNPIKPAIDEPRGRVQNVIEPEIVKQVYYNGTQRTVVYISKVISPGEREILDQIEKAENDLMAMSHQRDQRDIAMNLELTLQEERLRNMSIINTTMLNEYYASYPYPQLTAFPLSAIVPFAVTDFATMAQQRSQKGILVQLSQAVPPQVSPLDRVPPVDMQAYSKAREEYMRLIRTSAIFEDGRIVAVAARDTAPATK